MMALFRQKSDLKPPFNFKEKFVSVYEDIFSGSGPVHAGRDKGIAGRGELQRFWDELFLLKVNEPFLAQCVAKTPETELVGKLKGTLNDLFGACVRYLGDDSFIRVAHALETAAVLLREIFKKRFNEQGYTIISLVAGSVEHADTFFKRMITDISVLLTRTDVPVLIKSLGLRLYLVILTATDNVNSNSIASYFFVNVVFESILSVLTAKILDDDGRRLEFDATLALLLLLLWRESENTYIHHVSSIGAPLLPLINTASSLLMSSARGGMGGSRPLDLLGKGGGGGAGVAAGIWDYLSSWMATAAEMGSAGLTAAGIGIGNVFGGGMDGGVTHGVAISGDEASPRLDASWGSSTAGIILIYFLIHHNTIMRSPQVWGLSSAPATPGHSLSVIWWHVFRMFLGEVSESVVQTPMRGALGVLRTKLCLVILRCMVEDAAIVQCLARSDVKLLNATVAVGPPVMGPGVAFKGSGPVVDEPNFRSVLGLIVDLVVNLMDMVPGGSTHMDADMYGRAITIVSIVLSFVKAKGKPWGVATIDWERLWKSLIKICNWASDKTVFQKPGVPEVASQTIGVLEFALGSSQELVVGVEETERLQGIVLANMDVLEKLEATAVENNFGGDDTRPSISGGGVRLVNISAVRDHYELQLSIIGRRAKATEVIALAAVKKKGVASLKLKPRHSSGAGHTYMEGTAENRIINGLMRPLISEYKRKALSRAFKFETDGM